jgi:hypothetical protein
MAISFSFLFLRRVRISNGAANFAGNYGQALREWKLLKVTKGAGAVKQAEAERTDGPLFNRL